MNINIEDENTQDNEIGNNEDPKNKAAIELENIEKDLEEEEKEIDFDLDDSDFEDKVSQLN